MCHAVRCRTCQKTTWSGCGQHIAGVRRQVAARDWCDGKHTPAEIQAAKDARGGFFSRLFGRRPTSAEH